MGLFAENYTGKKYAKYALAIGQVAICWNHLHEQLSVLFQTVMMLPHDSWHPRPKEGKKFEDEFHQWLAAHRHSRRMAKAAWNSLGFDRPKRDMLRAALGRLPKWIASNHPKLQPDVKWLLGEVEALEEVRNNVIHAPLISLYFSPPDDENKYVEVPFPSTDSGNARALKLAPRDLITEYRYCRNMALALADYAHDIILAIDGETPWPKKPRLPNREPKTRRLDPHRQYALGRLSPQLRAWLLKPLIDD